MNLQFLTKGIYRWRPIYWSPRLPDLSLLRLFVCREGGIKDSMPFKVVPLQQLWKDMVNCICGYRKYVEANTWMLNYIPSV